MTVMYIYPMLWSVVRVLFWMAAGHWMAGTRKKQDLAA
jgi:hypothetical protein